ncbi:MAG TPA: site-specific integrase, partial [Chloroflexota bacterium]|nr:site-specific integrase [Chloroflexota bacterium]
MFYRADRGRWVAEVRVEGKPVVRYAATEREAKRLRLELLRLTRRPVTARLTLAAWLTRWQAQPERAWAPSTRETYGRIIRLHIVPALGAIALSRLTPAHVQTFQAGQVAFGLAARSVRLHMAVLSEALGDAVRLELVERNVAALVRLVAPPDTPEPAALTASEARAILAAVAHERLAAVVLTGLALGLRQGELLGLRWIDVDLDAATVHVRQQLRRDGMSGPLKRRYARVLPLPALVVEALRRERARQDAERVRAEGY